MFTFATLDPRNIPAAAEANDKMFASGLVYGIEVTVPALAKRCIFNLDPQHLGGDANLTAIEDALTVELPPDGATLATIKADLDAVGSMAIFNLRAKGESLEFAMERINVVATTDKFAHGDWPGVRPLPTRDNPWNEKLATVESSRPLAAIAAMVADFKVSLTDRVAAMQMWLLTGKDPIKYRAQVEKERLEMITALESGEIKWGLAPCRYCGSYNNTARYCADCGEAQVRIATVISTHRTAIMLGYHLAPVVVALNPSFRQGPGEPYKKFTICAFETKFVDIKSALAELNELEPGWGGSPLIGGSPQGVSSVLTVEDVVRVIQKHIFSSEQTRSYNFRRIGMKFDRHGNGYLRT